MSLQMVVFDVDGTLVDSQADIMGAMRAAFEEEQLAPPTRAQILNGVGLSLPILMQRLVPDVPAAQRGRLVQAYKDHYAAHRVKSPPPPLYPGIRALLDRLVTQDDLLLGVATGKSRRGLDGLLDAHNLRRHFVTMQVADDHPSKPHPAMLEAALSDTGLAPHAAIMVGDTSFDIDMGRHARMGTIGVSWGYHSAEALSAASIVVHEVDALEAAIPNALGGIC